MKLVTASIEVETVLSAVHRFKIITVGIIAVLCSAYLSVSVAQGLASPRSASANSLPGGVGFGTYSVSGDTLYTWDFDSTTASSSNVDWAVRFIFKSNAEIDYVKDRLDGVGSDPYIWPYLDDNGGGKWGYVYDGAENQGYWQYDSDSGIKEGASCTGNVWDWGHMRLYANTYYDRNYNMVWGYYVVGTSHQDKENGSCSYDYRSWESHESGWNSRLNAVVSSHGWSYSSGYQYMGNEYSGYIDIGGGNHNYNSDGYATSVWVY